MEYIQLIAIIFCIYIVISILEQITLIEDFYSLLKTGSEIKQDDLREFMQETKERFKKENIGLFNHVAFYKYNLHSYNSFYCYFWRCKRLFYSNYSWNIFIRIYIDSSSKCRRCI